jgi:hypothetical protein
VGGRAGLRGQVCGDVRRAEGDVLVSTVGLYAYDGDSLPVEIFHIAGRRETLCGLSLLPIKWRVTDQHPISGSLCPNCAQANAEGEERLLDLIFRRES